MTPPRPTLHTTSAADTAARDALTVLIDRVVQDPRDGQNLLRVEPALNRTPSARICLARADGVPVAGVATWLDPAGTHGWLGSLAVHRDWRGHGLASRLVRFAMEDREACDGQALPLLATVRIWPNGEVNSPSFHALAAAGFEAGAVLRVRVADFGPRGAHLDETVEADGCIRVLLVVRIIVPAAYAEVR